MDDRTTTDAVATPVSTFDLGAWIGRGQAFRLIPNHCSAAQAECLTRGRAAELPLAGEPVPNVVLEISPVRSPARKGQVRQTPLVAPIPPPPITESPNHPLTRFPDSRCLLYAEPLYFQALSHTRRLPQAPARATIRLGEPRWRHHPHQADKPELKVPRTESRAAVPNRQFTQSANHQIATSSLDPLMRATLLPSLLALLRTFLFFFPPSV